MMMENKETNEKNTTTDINKSSENIVNNKNKQWPQYLAAMSASLTAVIGGSTIGWSSPVQILTMPPNSNSTNFISQYNFSMTDDEFSWAVSSVGLSAGICSLFSGTIQNNIGRKYALLILAIPFIIGWGLITGAKNFVALLIGRLFCGSAVGSAFVTTATYIGEVSDQRIRGRLATYNQVGIAFGTLLMYSIGAGMSLLAINIVSLIIPFIFIILFSFMPESPYYLVSQDRYADAIRSLKWLRGKNYDPTIEMENIKINVQLHKTEKFSICKIFKTKEEIKAIYISIGLMFFQQWTGINAVLFYTGFIFQQAGTPLSPTISTIIVGVLQLITTYISSICVDKCGRRVLLMLSIIIMLICTVLLGAFFYLYNTQSPWVSNLNWLPIFSLCLYIMAFAIGFGPIPFIVVGEIFNNNIKAIGTSLSMSLNFFLAFVIGKIFPYLSTTIGIDKTFWLFSGFLFVGLLFVMFFVPETKRKSLTEIQEMLVSGGTFVKLC